jgi:ATP-dependent helicase HrpA
LPATEGIQYPPELPITERREELLEIIGANQVVIVAGETGSGKSTQLPKLCLELGRGVEGRIGHTQPRRLAARSIAERVASELGGEVGGTVGYAVRFTDEVGDDTRVKLMTDGILLAEIRRDRDLRRYDTIIVDEAHERSLNIDFLLGYLRRLLPRRPDLKIIITSATIDTEKFSSHFEDAPVVTVSGRTYPVEIRYQDAEERDQPTSIADAVTDLFTERDGDVLVFCSGEREIRDAIEELDDLALPNTEVIPLFARLSAAEQHRVFASHRRRRVVVATNVAETSLTVPGIRSVVDVGTARISRFNRRTKVQRLPIEEISQASANQRAGRCGRLGPGVCIRLYSEESFDSRDEFTEPEIQRTNLASVILQMAALGIGDVDSFPFVDPPDSRSIRDGIAVLEELGAVDPERVGTRKWLTGLGRKLARLPVDPRLGRMVLAAADGGCLREVLVLAAGLSVQDPRDRPTGSEQQAAELHARFRQPGSDFLSMLALWDYLAEARSEGSSSRFRRVCKREFINYRRVREWQDVHAQLRRVTNELRLRPNRADASPDEIHQALLTGLLSHVGLRDADERDYRGARGARFVVARDSVLAKSSPRWVMAGEIVETNRLWARRIAQIQPAWIERAAPHQLKYSYGEPWWDGEQGLALVNERATLYGLPVVEGRPVPYRRVDRAAAREMFLHHALVEGDWHGRYPFRVHNRDVAARALDVEARTRRTDVISSDDQLLSFFHERVGDDVTSAGHFSRWWKKVRRDQPELLHLRFDDVVSTDAAADVDHQYPEVWTHGDLELDVDYQFEPGSAADGVTIDIPIAALHRVDRHSFEWLVPGKRVELVTELLRRLPKEYRKRMVPVGDTARRFVDSLPADPGPLTEVVRTAVSRHLGEPLPADLLRTDGLPVHLTPRYRIVDAEGEELASGDDLTALRDELAQQVRDDLRAGGHALERSGLTDFDLDEIPARLRLDANNDRYGYPALVEEGNSVGLRVLATQAEQAAAMWAGTRRLLHLNFPSQARAIRHLVDNDLQTALISAELGSAAGWYHDCAGAAVDQLIDEAGGPAWSRDAWTELRQGVADGLHDAVVNIATMSHRLLVDVARLRHRMSLDDNQRLEPTRTDIEGQLSRLIYPGFITAVGSERLLDLVRYVKAIDTRLSSAASNWRRDNEQMLKVLALEREHDRLVQVLNGRPELEKMGWTLQELRVAMFAQAVGAKGPVSEKRVKKALAAILDS